MKKIILYLLLLIPTFGFSQKVIHILPMGHIDHSLLVNVGDVVRDFYGFNAYIIEPEYTPSPTWLCESKKNYNVDSVMFNFLSEKHYLIITPYPIAELIADVYEKPMRGSGYIRGNVAIVSTFELKTDNDSLFTQRVIKVCLHEIGHNMGYEHCTTTYKCIMFDGRRGLKGVDGREIWICDDCRRKLKYH